MPRGSALVHPVTGRIAHGSRRCRRISTDFWPRCACGCADEAARLRAMELGDELAAAGLDWIVPDWPVPGHVARARDDAKRRRQHGRPRDDEPRPQARDDTGGAGRESTPSAALLPAAPTWLDQVHGAAVVTLTAASLRAAGPTADAAVTRERGVVCAVLTADCLPVLFADRGGNAVGIAHAGWRGLAAGVLEATIAALRDLGASADDLVAWLGPRDRSGPLRSRRRCARSVLRGRSRGAGAASRRMAPASGTPISTRSRERASRAAAVPQVGGGGYCTHSDAARFFSYRRERDSGPDGHRRLACRATDLEPNPERAAAEQRRSATRDAYMRGASGDALARATQGPVGLPADPPPCPSSCRSSPPRLRAACSRRSRPPGRWCCIDRGSPASCRSPSARCLAPCSSSSCRTRSRRATPSG